jgi:hypothetical protein
VTGTDVAVCNSCGSPVIWVHTGSGRLMPVDAEPVAGGNVEVTDGRAKVWGTAHAWPTDAPRYRSHFATCPHASSWRRK